MNIQYQVGSEHQYSSTSNQVKMSVDSVPDIERHVAEARNAMNCLLDSMPSPSGKRKREDVLQDVQKEHARLRRVVQDLHGLAGVQQPDAASPFSVSRSQQSSKDVCAALERAAVHDCLEETRR